MFNEELWIGALCRSDSCTGRSVRVSRKGAKETQSRNMIDMTENEISKIVVDLCFRIHKQYGPGLFEKVYEEIFCYEWNKLELPLSRQKGIKVVHDGVDMGIGFIPDIIVCDQVIIEVKSIEDLAEVHYKQLLTYLRLTNLKLGLLVNF